jgi:flagellar motor protein MotB
MGVSVLLCLAGGGLLLRREANDRQAALLTQIDRLSAEQERLISRLDSDVRQTITNVQSAVDSRADERAAAAQTAAEQLREDIRAAISETRVPQSIAAQDVGDGHAQLTTPSDRGVHADFKIDVPGVSVRDAGSDAIVTFDSGLFVTGTILSPHAKALLTDLGHQLQPWVGRITVHVAGQTDSTPVPYARRYGDNAALGMARAMAVVDHLRATTGLPASLFSVGAAGESQAPYPNDTPDNRRRNRTVVLRISAKSSALDGGGNPPATSNAN